jgi:hypothetical protein
LLLHVSVALHKMKNLARLIGRVGVDFLPLAPLFRSVHGRRPLFLGYENPKCVRERQANENTQSLP